MIVNLVFNGLINGFLFSFPLIFNNHMKSKKKFMKIGELSFYYFSSSNLTDFNI